MRFVVPAQAEVERQALRGTPIVLRVQADLRVVRIVVRVAELELDVLGDLEAVGIRPHEGRVLGIALQHIIRQQIDVHAGLDNVLPAAVEPGIREIIAECEPALLEILDRVVAADPRREAAQELRDAAGVIGMMLIAIALISDCELVEQRAAENRVLSAARPRIHVQQRSKLPRVIGDAEESSEFPQVAVVTIIDRQVQRRRGSRFVAQLAKKE